MMFPNHNKGGNRGGQRAVWSMAWNTHARQQRPVDWEAVITIALPDIQLTATDSRPHTKGLPVAWPCSTSPIDISSPALLQQPVSLFNRFVMKCL
jgi:hypothetical protein